MADPVGQTDKVAQLLAGLRQINAEAGASGASIEVVVVRLQDLIVSMGAGEAAFKRLFEAMSAVRAGTGGWNRALAEAYGWLSKLTAEARQLEDPLNAIAGEFAQLKALSNVNMAKNMNPDQVHAFEKAAKGASDSISRLAVPAAKAWINQIAVVGTSMTGGSPAILNLVAGIKALKTGFAALRAAMAVAGGPITLVIAALSALAAILGGLLIARLEDAQQMVKSLGGTVGGSADGEIKRWTQTIANNQLQMALHRISIEDLSKATQQITGDYGVSAAKASKFGLTVGDYTRAATDAIIKTLAMAKVTSLTNEQAMKFTSTFGILGGNVRLVDEAFGRVAATAERVGLNVDDMVKAVTTAGTANIYAEGSMNETTDTLASFASGIMTADSALFNVSNRAPLAAKAIQAVADASSKMDLGQILAFGGAMTGMTGTIDEMITKAAKMDRAALVGKGLEMAGGAAGAGSHMAARLVMAQNQFGMSDLNTALAVAAGETSRQRRESKISDTESIRKMNDLLSVNKFTANKVSDIAGMLGRLAGGIGSKIFGMFGGTAGTGESVGTRRGGRPVGGAGASL